MKPKFVRFFTPAIADKDREIISELPERPLKKCLIVYLMDTSGSMKNDGKMLKCNNALRSTIEMLRNENGKRVLIYVSIISFGSEAKNLTPGSPDCVDDIVYNDMEADGLTSMGAAFEILDKDVLTADYMQSDIGWKAPILILCSDGAPTDCWNEKLASLRQNPLFKESVRIAFAIDCADDGKNVLREFTGDSETLLEPERLEDFEKCIKYVSLVSARNQDLRNGNTKKAGDTSKKDSNFEAV